MNSLQQPIRIAVAGTGTMARLYLKHFAMMKEVRIIAVCGRTPESAQSVAAPYGAQAFESLEDMMDRADPDVVCVCLPTYLHKDWTLGIAARGKHVICEKPIAGTLEDAREMEEACRRAGVRLFIGHSIRFFPAYAAMKRQVEAGQIGKVGVVHAKRMGPHPALASEWYADREKSGGVIRDLMIHDIDFLRWTLGEVQTVYAAERYTGAVDYALVTLRFEQGAIANLEGYWGYPGPFTTAAEFAGDRGILRHDSFAERSLAILRSKDAASGAAEVAVPDSPSVQDPYEKQLRHFVACIRNGEKPLVTAGDAREALRIALAAEQSAKSGQPFRLAGETRG